MRVLLIIALFFATAALTSYDWYARMKLQQLESRIERLEKTIKDTK